MTLRVAVAGVGAIGRRHAQNVAALWPRARLVAVADVNQEAAEAVARELECDWFSDAGEMLGRADVQAVVIASSADSHASLSIAAAEAGKDVLVEEPLSLT